MSSSPQFNRYSLTIYFKKMPCMENDIYICKEKHFKSLRDIAQYTGMSYNIVSDIHRPRVKSLKYNGSHPLHPIITIEKLAVKKQEPHPKGCGNYVPPTKKTQSEEQPMQARAKWQCLRISESDDEEVGEWGI